VSVTAFSGGLAIYHADTVSITLAAVPGPAFGWQQYRAQVQAIVPAGGLKDRTGELAALTAFCAGPGAYWWWQAEAWAGKSALMSSFVLDPPAGVTVVPFFVTARLAAQDDATAFAAGVLAQLDELSGSGSGRSSRDAAALPWRLDELAGRLHAQGRTLVLAVDGLDEDRGSGTGQPSIASLLPKHCPAGLKVIVASRPGPRLPADVPADHPLRDPAAAHRLAVSRHAQVIRDSAELELSGLLSGPPQPRELLGLIAAAGGGLTQDDLEELTGLAPYQLAQVLRGVAGRTFVLRAASPARAPAYLLAHEELQAEALRSLGRRQLAGFRDRLHAWADSYAAQGWPPDTPAYLLSGYAALLRTAGDTGRMIRCLTDSQRHERLFAATGGDYAALAEIAAAQDLLGRQPSLDLTALGRLACHRARLGARNRAIPPNLPAVWARLGDAPRAVALARSLPGPEQRASALTAVATALAHGGQPGPATAAARQAVQAASDGPYRDKVLRDVVVRLAGAGLAGPAQEAAALARDDSSKADIMTAAATALAEAGYGTEAETAARSIAAARQRRTALTALLAPLAAAGQADDARRLADEIAAAIRSQARTEQRAGDQHPDAGSTQPFWLQKDLSFLAEALAGAGLCAQAQEIAGLVEPGGYPIWARTHVTKKLARAGQADRAYAVAAGMEPGSWQDQALVIAVVAMGQAGDPGRAVTAASALGSPALQASALTGLIATLPVPDLAAWLPQLTKAAEAAVTAIRGRGFRAGPLTALAIALARAGQPGRARPLIDQAVAMLPWDQHRYWPRQRPQGKRVITATGGVTEPYYLLPNHGSRGAIAEQLARAGLGELAEAVARRAEKPEHEEGLAQPGDALAQVVCALASNGHAGQAAMAARRAAADYQLSGWSRSEMAWALAAAGQADQAIELARAGAGLDMRDRDRVLAPAAETLAARGQTERAVQLAESISAGQQRSQTLAQVAMTVAERGNLEWAAELATRAATHSGSGTYEWDLAAEALATALAGAGQAALAGRLIRAVTRPVSRSRALGRLAIALAGSGRLDEAQQAAQDAVRAIQKIDQTPGAAPVWEWSLSALLWGLAEAGAYDLAEATARAVPDTDETSLRMLIRALAATGQTDDAVTLARSFSDPGHRADALVSVLASTGAHPLAAGLRPAAEAAARLLTSPAPRAELLGRLAAARAAAGQPGPAGALAEEAGQAIQSAGNDPQVVLAVVCAMAGGHRPTWVDFPGVGTGLNVNGLGDRALGRRAEALARSISPVKDRNTALAAVGMALAEAGWLDDAQRIARAILAGPPERTADEDRLIVSSESYPSADQIITAVAIASIRSGRPAPDGDWLRGFGAQGPGSGQIAAALVRAGQPDQAEALANSYAPGLEGDRKTTVAVALASAGLAERAQTLAGSVRERPPRMKALAAVACALAEAGRCEQAETVARSIDDRGRLSGGAEVPGLYTGRNREWDEEGDDYPGALLVVAQAWIKAGELARARRLVALAWRAGPWSGPLEELAELDPDALVALGQDLLAIAGLGRDSG
jgi:hypothetical protein